MSKELRNIISVSGTTILSRITGLLRDVLIVAALGASIWSSAFILGFTLPNLFRRLFGEGALTSAFIPIFSAIYKKESTAKSLLFFNRFLFRWVLFLLGFISLFYFIINSFLSLDILSFRWEAAFELLNLLLPYILLVCLAAIAGGALNVFGRFLIPAAAPIVFNLCLILFILIGMVREEDAERLVIWLCFGVLAGGLLQLLLPLFELFKFGWLPRWAFRMKDQQKEWLDFWSLFTPSLIGAAVLQINLLISRLLAYTLEDSAVTLLYISSRLMELPLGVFTIAIVTVYFPSMARAFASESVASFQQVFYKGLRLILLIVAPSTIGLWLLSEPILVALFEWGSFASSDVLETVPIVSIFALSLPFYSMATYYTRTFYAQKNMRAPVKVSAYVLIINTVFSLLLMPFIGIYGLALANLISALFFCFLLQFELKKAYKILILEGVQSIFLPVCTGCLGILLLCIIGQALLGSMELNSKMLSLLTLVTLIPSSAFLYFYILYKSKVKDIAFLGSYLGLK